MAESGAGGRDVVRKLGTIERLLGFGLVLLGNDVVDRLLHLIILLPTAKLYNQSNNTSIHSLNFRLQLTQKPLNAFLIVSPFIRQCCFSCLLLLLLLILPCWPLFDEHFGDFFHLLLSLCMQFGQSDVYILFLHYFVAESLQHISFHHSIFLKQIAAEHSVQLFDPHLPYIVELRADQQ